MGDIVKFPACREVKPEISDLIDQQTKKAAYWVKQWSEINKRLCETDPEKREVGFIQEASQYLHQWLSERNRTALKMRGF